MVGVCAQLARDVVMIPYMAWRTWKEHSIFLLRYPGQFRTYVYRNNSQSYGQASGIMFGSISVKWMENVMISKAIYC